MPHVFIGIGSNINRENNIRFAVRKLRDAFGKLAISSIYESKAFGFEGDNFYNLVVGFDSELGPEQISKRLREIEDQLGRERNVPRYSSRTLDLDLLLYGDLVSHENGMKLPRQDVVRFAFVLCPLAEIAADLKHPLTGKSYAEIWAAFDKTKHELWPVKLDISGD